MTAGAQRNDIVVRPMTSSDFPAWIAMRSDLWPDCPPERHELEVRQLLEAEGVVLLAEDGTGRAIGFAEVSIRHDHVEGTSIAPVPYLEGWYVVPGERGRGVGAALMKAVGEWAANAGYAEIASDAELDNDASIRAHLRLGFRAVGRTVHFVRELDVRTDEAAAPAPGKPGNPT